jgi:uncharacterized membrane protein
MRTYERLDASRGRSTTLPRRLGWWVLLAICTFYGNFAVVLAVVEVLSWTGAVHDAKQRAVPVVFVTHAVSGGVALVSGVLQLNQRLRRRSPKLHRVLGRFYVGAIWTASAGGLWSALYFDVTLVSRLLFGLVATLWFATTTVAFRRIRQRRVAAHREWMIRSFAFSLFFVTFELWVAALEATPLPQSIAYPVSILLSWSFNLAVAEAWIRYTRPVHRVRSTRPDKETLAPQAYA